MVQDHDHERVHPGSQANGLGTLPRLPVAAKLYEHVIRAERALQAVRQHIAGNRRRWHLDRYNPLAAGSDPHLRDIEKLLHDSMS